MQVDCDSRKYKTVNLRLPMLDQALSLEVYSEADLVSTILSENNIWEPYETEVVIKRLNQGASAASRCFVDVGANIGYYSLIAARCFGAKVYAFEPEACNFQLLKRNLASCDSVKLFNAALSDHQGRGKLYLSEDNLGDHRLAETSERKSQQIETVTGDSVIDGRVDFIKIDTQGAEYKVLRGLTDTIKKNHDHLDMIVEFWPEGLRQQGNSAAELIHLMTSFDMNIYIIDHQQHDLIPARTRDLTQFSSIQAKQENGGGFLNLFLTTTSVVGI